MPSRLRHLLVDARPIDHPTARQRGIGRYVTGLLRGLAEIDAPFTALLGSEREAGLLDDVVGVERIRPWSPQAVRDVAEPGSWYLATQLMLHPVSLDPIPRVVTEARLPVAAVMYDVIPYRYPERYQVVPAARRLAELRAPLARTVDVMLAISEFAADTAAEELAYPRDRISSIGAGVEPQFVPPDVVEHAWPGRILDRSTGGYVVSVTGGDERKNTDGLLRAWAVLPANVRTSHRLVVVAAHTPALLRQWRKWADDLGIGDTVVFTGSVTDDEMVALLQHAHLAVMPSTEEGFGLPVVEAAACGCPVICSDVSSLPEVLAEPAAGFDPYDPSSIASAIERGLADEAHRDVLRRAGAAAAKRWTWRSVAADAVAAVEAVGPRWRGVPRRPQRRIAIAGPFEGSPSGIGRYDVALTAAIERLAAPRSPGASGASDGRRPRDVRVVRLVDTSGGPEPVGPDVDRWSAAAVDRFVRAWDLDEVVAVFGSSPYHVAVDRLARLVPSHVWLHDASLVGLHVGLAHMSGSQAWAERYVAERIVASEGDGALRRVLGRDPGDVLRPDRLAEAGITLLRETIVAARSVIVSSERAAATVRAIAPDGPPLLVLPHAYPPAEPPPAVPSERRIVAAGWLDTNKAPTTAVEVLRRLRDDHGVDATLEFVGGVAGDAGAQVERAAAAAGIEAAVTITGHLGDAEFRGRLATARLGLQLRTTDRGEMSGAIADLVASGIPTVTTLATAAPSSPGLLVLGDVADVEAIVTAALALLVDDDAWAVASADAIERARAWTFHDVADALLDWLEEAGRLDPGTQRVAGPATGTRPSDPGGSDPGRSGPGGSGPQ